MDLSLEGKREYCENMIESENYDLQVALACTLIASSASLIEKKKKKKAKKRFWVRPYLQQRDINGSHIVTVNALLAKDPHCFRRYLRMSSDVYEELLERIRPFVTKKNTMMRKAISADERLSVTLRFLATGHSFVDLEADFKISRITISKIIFETCEAIYTCLKDEYLKMPQTEEEWKAIAQKTQERWQFPNCFGAADGKHIPIQHPKNSGSEFYNYKGFFSIVLLAIVDYDYKFLYVDVGSQGRISDGGVFRNCAFNKAMERGDLKLPQPKPLPISPDPIYADDQNPPIPFVFVADDAFPLGEHCMKPYPQTNLSDRKRIFNYRLSRMRRISENVFGIWGNRFRVFTHSILLSPEKVETITLATVVLHNLLRVKGSALYTDEQALDKENEDGSVTPGTWRSTNMNQSCSDLSKTKDNHAPKTAEKIRDVLADHFYGPGAIPWQWNMLV